MAITIEGLQIEITQNSEKAVEGLDALTKSLERLKKTTGDLGKSLEGVNFDRFNQQMKQLSTSLRPLQGFKTQASGLLNSLRHFKRTAEEINEFTGFDRFASQIKTLANSLTPLSGFNTKLGATLNALLELPVISDTLDTVDFESFGNNIKQLTNSLTPLTTIQTRLGSTLNQLSRFEQVAQQLDVAFQGTKLADNILKLVEALRPLTTLGKSTLGSMLNQLRKLPEIMEQLSKVNMDALSAQIERVVNAVRPLAEEMNKVAAGFSAFPSRIQRLITLNERLATSNKKVGESFGVMGTGISQLKAKLGVLYFALRRAARQMGEWVQESNAYVENLNLFRVSMREGADEALDFANKVYEIFGVDPSEWIRYQAVFQNMATGFGIASDKAAIMSRALTQLGYDLATIFNVNYDVAMQKLESALAGQPRPMREWGFDMSETTLKLVALKHGIEENVEKMTQYEKAQLRFVHLMETANKQGILGNFARELHTPANAMRILNQQIRQLRRALGDLLIPILMKVVPYLQAFVMALTDAVRALAAFFGFELPTIDYSSLEALSPITAGANEATDAIEGTTKAAKKLRRAIMGFDEINLLPEPTSSTPSGGAGSAGGGVSFGRDLGLIDDRYLYDFFGGINKQTDELKEKMKELLKWIGLIGAGLLSWKIANSIYTLFTTPNVGRALFEAVRNIWKAWKSPSGATIKLASLLGNKTAYVGTAAVIAGIAATVGVILIRTIDLIKNSERFREGLAAIGKAFKNAFDWAINEAFPAIGDFFKKIIPPEAITAIKDFFGQFSGLVEALDLDFADLLLTLGGIALLFTPGAPFGIALLGFEAITLAIRGIGYGASDVIEELDVLGEGISDITREKMRPFLDQMRALDDTLTEIDWANLKIDDDIVKDVEQKTKAVVETILNELDSDKNEALKTLEPLRDALGEDAYNKLIEDNERYYSDIAKRIKDGETRINEIVKKASEENRELKTEEKKEIKAIIEEMNETGIKHLSETEVEYKTIMRRLKENSLRVSLEQASGIIKNAKKTKEETIKAAETQYTKQLMEAQRMLDVGAINKDEYDAIVKAARETRDKTVADAEKQYNDIYNTTIEKLGDTAKYIDEETGNIKSKWQVLTEDLSVRASEGWEEVKKEFSKKWGEIDTFLRDNVYPKFTKKYWKDKFWGLVDGAKEALDELKKKFENWKAKIKLPHIYWSSKDGFKVTNTIAKTALEFLNLPTTIPKLKVSWYAQGGFPDRGELFVAREAGPELVGSIGGRTAVANNDQIVAAVSKGVAQAVSKVLGQGGSSGDIVLQVGETELGRVVIDSINKLQKQEGKILLEL